MLNFPRLALVVALFPISACVESVDYEALQNARMRSFLGQTMAQFSQSTGLIPQDAYDTKAGRTFVVPGPVSTVYLPPAYGVPGVAAQNQCQILLGAKRVGTGDTADDWEIESATWRGPCGGV